jgi:serine/threonine protein kinase
MKKTIIQTEYSEEHQLVVEQAVLGSILINSEAILEVSKEFSVKLFSDERNVIIADAILKLHIDSKPIDLLTLVDQLKKKNKLETLKKITTALIPIFEDLRKNNIVHCDIKPSNLLVNEKAQQFSMSLIDFGLSITTTEDNSSKILFPLGYAAPELILNRKKCINHTSDLFSYGIVIWRLFEDKLPLSHPNPSVYTNLQITYPLPDGNEMGKDLNQIIKKMCFKHQFSQAPNLMNETDVDQLLLNASNERYQTLPEVLKDLIYVNDRKSWINRILS